jgi:hypothetical protein
MNITCVPSNIRLIYAKKMEQLEESMAVDVDLGKYLFVMPILAP